MKALEIMSSPVITVKPDMPVREAVEVMLAHHISGLPVVDQAGRLVGIVSEADLVLKEAEPKPETPPLVQGYGRFLWLERWVSGYRKVRGRTVGEVMTHNVITATVETPVSALASLMVRYRINRIPIVRGVEVVGIVTRADILKTFLRSDEALAEEAARVAADFPGLGETVQVSVKSGIVMARGQVASPGRHAWLVRRLEKIDGIVAVDDSQLEHLRPERAAFSE